MKISFRNKTIKVLIILAIFTVFILGIHFTLGRWILIENLKKDQELAAKIQGELKKKEELIKQYPNPGKKIEEIKTEMEELKKKSVSEQELPKVIQQLTKKSSELKIEIISIRPIKEIQFKERPVPSGVSKAYIEIVLKVPYKTLGEYIKTLDELPVIFTIESIDLERFEELEEAADSKKAEEIEGKVIATLLVSSYTIWEI